MSIYYKRSSTSAPSTGTIWRRTAQDTLALADSNVKHIKPAINLRNSEIILPVDEHLRALKLRRMLTEQGVYGSVTGAHRWNPGNGAIATHLNSSNTDANIAGKFDLIKTNANFNQVMYYERWRVVEPTQGNYDFSTIRQWRDYVNNVTNPGSFATPKFFSFSITTQNFNGPSFTSGTQSLPQYVIDNGWTRTTAYAGYADLRISACQAAFQAMLTALAAEFNGDPWIEMFKTDETANMYVADYDFMTVLASQMTSINVSIAHNFIGLPQGSGDAAFKNSFVALGLGAGGPDALSGAGLAGLDESWGQLAFRGAGSTSAGGGGAYDYGSIDSRGVVPNSLELQVQWGAQTPAQILSYCSQQKVTHMFWSTEDVSPGDWASVQAAVAANPSAIWTTRPTFSGY